MDDILFGMETELAFSALHSVIPDVKQEALFDLPVAIGSVLPGTLLDLLLADFIALGRDQLCSLPDAQSSGIYLGNGSRLYLDAGRHPEFCTPECQSPEEVVRWQLAGERIVVQLCEELMKLRPDNAVSLFRGNVDYSGSQTTWGCHESYQHKTMDETQMSAQLIPHLVTRIVYTGAGGLNNRREQAEFLLSPRVPHLEHEVGGNSQSHRSLYHTKNEPLGAGDFNRLHLICGESNASQLSTYLKFGTTALIVRLIDQGLCRGDELTFRQPLRSMRAYARDPSCRTKSRIRNGRRMTAVEVQREYLGMAEEHLNAEFMPEWAPLVCQRWRHVLDQLETDPMSLSTILDWTIKYALFQDRITRARSSWSGLKITRGLGAELCEVDTRFGELGFSGLFQRLDQAGALDHRLPELGSIEEAMISAPLGGRAEARGEAIRDLHSDSSQSRYKCRWDAIFDSQDNRVLDMSDSYGRDPEWHSREIKSEPRTPEQQRQRDLAEMLQNGTRRYHDVELSDMCDILTPVAVYAREAGEYEIEALARFWCATGHHDQGQLEAAENILTPILETVRERAGRAIACRVLTRYAIVLIDRPADRLHILKAIEQARACLEEGEQVQGQTRVDMVEARFLGALGHYGQAIEIMERALEAERWDFASFARSSYQRWLVYYLLRTHQLERASSQIDQWREDLEGGDSRYDSRVMLSCAASTLARSRGRFDEAFEHAQTAIGCADRAEPNRYRLNAYCAFVESAVAAGKAEAARPYLEVLRSWGHTEIGEQRCDIEVAESVFYRATRQKPQSTDRNAQGTTNTPEAAGRHGVSILEGGFLFADHAALVEARNMDEALGTEHHAREVAEGCRPVG